MSRISWQDLRVFFTGVVTIVKFPITHQDRTTTYQYYTGFYMKSKFIHGIKHKFHNKYAKNIEVSILIHQYSNVFRA
jgi:hypothetical protein